MTVNEVSGNGFPIQPGQPRRPKDEPVSRRDSGDRVELSDEARSMFEADQTRRLEDIRRKIDAGFYAQKEVAEKVVDAILREIA